MRDKALGTVAVENSWILLYYIPLLPFPVSEHHLWEHGMQN